jgi:nitrite reductase/ring-hydroxylating ferredoxin subunit
MRMQGKSIGSIDMAKYVVARAREIGDGERKLVHIRGRDIVIFNLNHEYFAILNRCPHEGGSLYHGDQIGCVRSRGPGSYEYSADRSIIRCPWHAWEFDIRTGQSYCDPKRIRVRRYAVGESSGTELIKGPYVAETFDVSQDESYVYVDL